MPKRRITEVIERVNGVLTATPKTVGEIARDADVSWEGARKALELLAQSGAVVKVRHRNKDYYFRLTTPYDQAIAEATIRLLDIDYAKNLLLDHVDKCPQLHEVIYVLKSLERWIRRLTHPWERSTKETDFEERIV